MNVATNLATTAARRQWTSRPALYTEDRMWTHGQVHDLAARLTTVFAGCGVRPGQRVLLALPDGIGWVASFLGLARLGAVAVLANPALTAADYDTLVDDSDAVAAISEADLADSFAAGQWWDVEDLLATAATAATGRAHPVRQEDELYVQYTSGTTGRPKGVPHRHSDLACYHRVVGEEVLGVRPHEVTLSVSRLYFAYGFGNSLVFPLFSGSAAVLTRNRPAGEELVELIRRHGVTLLYSVPSGYANLLAVGTPRDFATLRAAVCAGEALSEVMSTRINAALATPVLDQLGSTEVGHAFCANSVSANRPGTVGRALSGYQVRVLGKDGTEVEPESPGELWVRGATVFDHYLNNPEDTKRVLVDGWLCTRDRVIRHADGTFSHLGRTDDLELVGGITLSPLEVERVLGEHPAVSEVVVAAVANEQSATKLRAFVVPTGQDWDRQQVAAELIELARRRLAAFKVPRTVEFVTALPRTSNGKIRRSVVRRGTW